ncbi:MAG: glycoside hydrolase family 18 [Bacteroidaceae bacterium]
MKKIFKRIIALPILGVAALGLITSCSDWTEQEQLTIDQVTIQEQNPALYAQYLENLKAYKESAHQKVLVWFDNSAEKATGRVDNVTALPDSIDLVVMASPDNLPAWQAQEMAEVREKKGTKFLLSFDFDQVKLKYDLWKADVDAANTAAHAKAIADAAAKSEETGETVEPESVEEMIIPSFENYLVDTLNVSVSLVDKYNYNGMVFAYKGKGINLMTDVEKAQYLNYHNLFIGIVNDWVTRQPENVFVFQGYPQNLLNKDFLTNASLIVIPCRAVSAESGLTYQAILASVEGVPTDRLAVQIETTSLDDTDLNTGYWNAGSLESLIGAAEWSASSHDGFTVAGLGIYNVSNDYYTTGLSYSTVRSAINIINPSTK